jgi:hypothetical protein
VCCAARVVLKCPDDLPRVVDVKGLRRDSAGYVELCDAAAGVEEAVGARAVDKPPDDLPRVVNTIGPRMFGISAYETDRVS